jgi:hypothetical protein
MRLRIMLRMNTVLRFKTDQKIQMTLWMSALALAATAQTPVERATPKPGVPAAQRPSFSVPAPGPAEQKTWPFGTPSTPPATGAKAAPPPPREVPLVEKKMEELSNKTLSNEGSKALTINAAKWKHAETDNFILHYRRVTEAQKVAREVEYDLWFVATTLGAGKDRYQKKSHVYVFEDNDEWKQFLSLINFEMQWALSFAHGDDLYLNVRGAGNSGTGSFDSHTTAHETTHAVVSRLYPDSRWPLWLNEGFAEYMGGASVAARKGQSGKRFERNLQMADMSLSTLEGLTEYPSNSAEIHKLYQTSEKVVRFLMSEGPKERFVGFIDAERAGKRMQDAVLENYADKFKDWDTFMKRFERFSK